MMSRVLWPPIDDHAAVIALGILVGIMIAVGAAVYALRR